MNAATRDTIEHLEKMLEVMRQAQQEAVLQRDKALAEVTRLRGMLDRLTDITINWSGECLRETLDCRPPCPFCVAETMAQELAAPREA